MFVAVITVTQHSKHLGTREHAEDVTVTGFMLTLLPRAAQFKTWLVINLTPTGVSLFVLLFISHLASSDVSASPASLGSSWSVSCG